MFWLLFVACGEQVSKPPVSWCRFEAFVFKPENVTISESPSLTPPSLVVLSIALRTAPHPCTHQNEITAAACLVHRSFPLDRSAPKPVYQSHFCAVAAPAESVFPFDFRDRVSGKSSSQVSMKIEMVSSERALINYILAKLSKVSLSFCLLTLSQLKQGQNLNLYKCNVTEIYVI